MSIFAIAILVAFSASASASDLPAGRSVCGIWTPNQALELSVQSDSANPDAFLVSFSDGTFGIEYVRQDTPIQVPSDLNELASGIYEAGPLNWTLSLSILEIFEFKNNGSETFGPEDTVISSVDISEKGFSLTRPVAENTPNWGVKTTNTAISEDGLVTIVFITNTDYVFYTLDGDIDPTEIHMSLRISRYNFSQESDSLGLKISVKSQSSTGMIYQESSEGGSFNITTAQPFAGASISLKNSLYFDGTTALGFVTARDWNGENLTISYPMANTLIQDIVFKVRSNMTYHTDPDSLAPDPVVYLSGLGAASGIIVASVALVKRGRYSNHD